MPASPKLAGSSAQQPAHPPDQAALYRVLTESAPDAIVTIDEESIILSVNEAAERIFGYTAAELVGSSLTLLVPERLRAGHRGGVARYLATGQRHIPWQGVRVPLATKARGEIPVEISFGEFVADGRRVFSGFIRDISDRVASERALAAAHAETELRAREAERLAAELGAQALERTRLLEAEQRAVRRAQLLQSLTAAFAAVQTPAEVIRVFLEHGVDALGACTGLVMLRTEDGESIELAGSRGYPPGLLEPYRRTPVTGPLATCAVVRTGASCWLATREEAVRGFPALEPIYDAGGFEATASVPIAAGDGRVVGALTLNYAAPQRFDAEERGLIEALARQCAQALERARLFEAERAARGAAEAANRAKSEFLAVMSHELRTPLTAIGGYADLMAMGLRGKVTDEQRDDLARLKRAQEHLVGVISDVLEVANIEAGRVTYSLQPVRVDSVLAGLGALVQPQADAKGVAYAYDGCAGDVVACADPAKLRQVVLNLLANAVKFTGRGGQVRLACAATPDCARISVADTGIGIAADQLERVFEPFVQLDQGRTRRHEGTGLGLAIAREWARGMGGAVEATSTPGVGSTFTVTLPRRCAEAADPPPRGAPRPPR